jgi:hypothetical protein
MKFTDDDVKMDERDEGAAERSGPDDENRSLSLMGGIARPEGMAEADEIDPGALDADAPRSGVLSGGTLILAVLVVVGIGSLYLMRATQGDLGASKMATEVNAKIEQALAKLTKPGSLSPDDPLRDQNMSDLFKDTESVLAMFASDPVKHQVPLEFVKKNPFDLLLERDKGPEHVPVKTGVDEALLRRQKLAMELGSLRLQSVIQGSRPTAIISNEIVVPGQRIGSFTVKAIEGFSVTLAVGNDVYVLKMDEKAVGGKR